MRSWLSQQRWTPVTFQGKAGANRQVFSGRLSPTRVLAVGRYRMSLLATDATGKRSAAVRVGFRMLDRAAVAQVRAARAAVLGWL